MQVKDDGIRDLPFLGGLLKRPPATSPFGFDEMGFLFLERLEGAELRVQRCGAPVLSGHLPDHPLSNVPNRVVRVYVPLGSQALLDAPHQPRTDLPVGRARIDRRLPEDAQTSLSGDLGHDVRSLWSEGGSRKGATGGFSRYFHVITRTALAVVRTRTSGTRPSNQ